jgi:hypothetical protein
MKLMKNIKNSKNAFSNLIVALVVAIIVIVAIGGASLFLMQNAASPSPSASPTPSTAPTPTSSPQQSASSKVATATSLQFTVTFTNASGFEMEKYYLQGKNLGNTNVMTRIDWIYHDTNGSAHELITIDNRAQNKVWTSTNSAGAQKWVLVPPDEFTKSQAGAKFAWQSNVNYLEKYWNGVNDVSAIVGDSTVRVFDISVNPALQDSLFQP